MPGRNGRSGRRPDKLDAKAKGEPVKPKDLDEIASKFWDTYLEHWLTVGCGAADTPQLVLMSETWSTLQRTFALMRENVLNKEARITMFAAAQRFDQLATEFGMTPLARSRMNIKSTEKDDPLKKFGIAS